jgi:hypothetical protein
MESGLVDSEDRPAFRIGWVSPEDFTDGTDEDEPKARRVRVHGLHEAPVLDSNGFRVEDREQAPAVVRLRQRYGGQGFPLRDS